jgi:hypothetical protein
MFALFSLAFYLSWLTETRNNPDNPQLTGAFASAIRLFFIFFSLFGAICSVCISSESGLGRQWVAGLEACPDLFLAIAGMLAGLPSLKQFFLKCFGWFSYIGSNESVAANMLLGFTRPIDSWVLGFFRVIL